jgi:hypothetical protein
MGLGQGPRIPAIALMGRPLALQIMLINLFTITKLVKEWTISVER